MRYANEESRGLDFGGYISAAGSRSKRVKVRRSVRQRVSGWQKKTSVVAESSWLASLVLAWALGPLVYGPCGLRRWTECGSLFGVG